MQYSINPDEDGSLKKKLKCYSIPQLESLAEILGLKVSKAVRFRRKPKAADLLIKQAVTDRDIYLRSAILPNLMHTKAVAERVAHIVSFFESTPSLTVNERLLANQDYAVRWIETDIAHFRSETKEKFTSDCERIANICEERVEVLAKELETTRRTGAAARQALKRFNLGDDNSYRVPRITAYDVQSCTSLYACGSLYGSLERYAATPISAPEEMQHPKPAEEVDGDADQQPPKKKRKLK
jgi:hypothetical protein